MRFILALSGFLEFIDIALRLVLLIQLFSFISFSTTKEFTEETNGGTPVNGWKAFFAVTKQVMTVNDKFFSILDSRSLPRMTSLWLNSDYVKCFNGSGELFTGYLLTYPLL